MTVELQLNKVCTSPGHQLAFVQQLSGSVRTFFHFQAVALTGSFTCLAGPWLTRTLNGESARRICSAALYGRERELGVASKLYQSYDLAVGVGEFYWIRPLSFPSAAGSLL